VHFQLFLFPAVAVVSLPHNGGGAAALTEMFISFRNIDSRFSVLPLSQRSSAFISIRSLMRK
jgi:hypothetical protein